MIYQEKKTTAMIYVNIIAVLLSILLNIYLIKEFQGYDAAWAAVLSVLVLTIIKYTIAKKHYLICINYITLCIVLFILSLIIFVDVYYLNYYVITSFLFKILLVILVLICILLRKKRFFKCVK
jgi:O-antigen/teichoic acid export membrane protein